MSTPNTAPSTFPALLLAHAAQRSNAPATREKYLGIWQTWSWSEVATQVRYMACGLASLGFKPQQSLAIIGDNRPRLYWSFNVAQSLRGVPVPLYQDAVSAEMAFVMDNAEIEFAVVEDQEQVDKLLEMREQLPRLKHIIYDNDRGMRHYSQAGVMSMDALIELGKAYNARFPSFFTDSVASVLPSDPCVMLYTSGTTGKPKGVVQTHAAMIGAATGGVSFDQLTSADQVLSYLPMAWVGDNLFSQSQWLVAGFTINCPESAATVTTDLREIGPTYYFAPPRVFENLLTTVNIRMEDAGWVKRKLFAHFMAVARRSGAQILSNKSVSLGDRVQSALGNVLIYGPLKNVLGLSRVRVAYTAGAAIGPDLFRFYRSIGVNLKQLYGQTETCAYVCLQPDGDVKLDTVGVAAPGMEIKIADNGEVLVRGVSILKEYYKRPDATAEVMSADGYFMTGDAGVIDADGHLKIIDRAKDVGKMAAEANFAMFAPNYIENKLKFFPYIKEAVVFGDGRKQVTAFINIDIEAVGNWAERRGLPYAGYVDLAGKTETYDIIAQCIESVNADLAKEAGMADTQIARFLVLHKELDPDDDELTRTRKVRRGFVAEKYAVLVEALYSEKTHQFIETLVKFEDGRTGNVSADLQIRNTARVLNGVAKAA